MSRVAPTPALIAAMALAVALLLALPARTITTAYVNDVLIFLDGAQRVAMGQMPNRDFHTALGPVVYFLPALGLWLSGRMGGALPVGMGILILMWTPVLVHVLASRLRPLLAILFAAFLLLILAAPTNLGDPLSSISFAMFYNRIGWAALALLAVLYLRPLTPYLLWRDAASAAILVLIEIYTKITYAPAAFVLLFLFVLDPLQRRWAGVALGMIGCGMLLIEFVWRGSAEHVRDLLATAQVSGERSVEALIRAALNNLADVLVFCVLAMLAMHRCWRLRDLCFYLFCLLGGILILSQNAHSWGIISLFGGAAVATETIMRRDARYGAGAAMLFLLLVVPPIGKHAAALGIHSVLAFSNFGAPLELAKFGDVRFGHLWSAGDNGFTELYIGSFPEGAALLAELGRPAERVLVLDFANPFSAGLGLEPPTGDLSWMHWGRNIGAAHHPAPEQLFSGASVVMIPKIGINSGQLSKLYGPYLDANFELARRTEGWTVFVSRADK